MTDKEKTKASKFLSLLLRHKPEVGNLILDANGWALTKDVLVALKIKHPTMNLTRLYEIVLEDEKQRYSFSNQFLQKIRANQGHSIDIDLNLKPIIPPDILYHGTAKKTEWLIRRDGLLPMGRQYVHLSDNYDTAIAVGKRHGDPLVILVKSGLMTNFAFYKSENGVWLTDKVPVEYLDFPYDLDGV